MATNKKDKKPIKEETSFTGSITHHKDGSLFIFIDIHNNKDGGIAKNVSLSKTEVNGIKKFLTFLNLD